MTSDLEDIVRSEHPLERSEFNAAQPEDKLPPLFWAALILFVANLLVLLGIWLSPELRVGIYGEDEGVLTGSYIKPSPFTERVEMATVRKPRRPEKVRPVLYQATEIVEAASLTQPTVTAPDPDQGSPDAQHVVERYSDFPRMTASAARSVRVIHAGTAEIAPRRLTEQP